MIDRSKTKKTLFAALATAMFGALTWTAPAEAHWRFGEYPRFVRRPVVRETVIVERRIRRPVVIHRTVIVRRPVFARRFFVRRPVFVRPYVGRPVFVRRVWYGRPW